ncbi:AAC(3) family N-acetyltransferase [Candidatus Poribacteria bacterium]|nr:AAC(3) family N-acetyltransferase [Candidatus Poribacteria bacterium]
MRVTKEKLLYDLRDLGVEPGDILFIHSSFKSLGPIEGGAETVVSTLEDAVGPEGLILMPSFNLVDYDKRAQTWNIETTPSTVGWLTEFFRRMPGTYRSDHYSHSVAARGKGAKDFVTGHLSHEGYKSPWDREPWGKTYGSHSPMYKAYQSDGKILMLGVDYDSSTYIHFVEVIYWNKLLDLDPEAKYPALNRPVLGEFWDQVSNLSRGFGGAAECRLFRIREYIDTLLREVEKNPYPYLKR